MRPGQIPADPYRSELFGICAILVALECICKLHQVNIGSVRLLCDGASALEDTSTISLYKSYTKARSDILAAIAVIREHLPIKIIPEHVDGHQDETKEISQLSYTEVLNINADRRAKKLLQYVKKEKIIQNLPIEEKWKVEIQGKPVVSYFQE